MRDSLFAKSLHELIGDGLPIKYHEATRMVVGQFGAREQGWDEKLAIMLLAGWYPDKRATEIKKAPHFQLRFWLVPKSVDALNAMTDEFRKFRLTMLLPNGIPNDLQWKWIDFDSRTAPKSHSLCPFLEKIDSERFGEQKLQLLEARATTTFWKNSSLILTSVWLG